jgi:hypothetical protein
VAHQVRRDGEATRKVHHAVGALERNLLGHDELEVVEAALAFPDALPVFLKKKKK